MGRYWKLMAEYCGETTTYAPVTATTSGASSPYKPDRDAHLIGLRVMESSQAVTTVATAVQFRLTSSSFKPESIEVGLVAAGLHTAPRAPPAIQDWTVDQYVKSGVDVTIEARVTSAYANVTNEVLLYGLFEV